MVSKEDKNEEKLHYVEVKQKDCAEEVEKLNEDADQLETVLSHVGELGRYQKFLFIAMVPFGFLFAFVYFVQMFIAATPQRHWCRVPELQHLDLELRFNLTAPQSDDDEWNRCATFDTNWTDVLQTMSPPPANTTTTPCSHGWEFHLEDIPYPTVVSERGWVCERSGYAPLAQALFFAGSFVGGILFGWMADRFGRIPALVGSNIVAFVGAIATIFTTDLWDFIISRFITGMAFDNCFMLMYILVLEYTGPKYRTWVANLSVSVFAGGAAIFLPWLALWIADWRRLVLVTALPTLLAVVSPFVLPESARWLISRGRVTEAVRILRKIERINGTKIPEEIIDSFIVSANPNKCSNESLVSLFRNAPLCRMMVTLLGVYMATATIFDGIVRMSDGLGLDFFLTFSVTSATEIPSLFFLVFAFDRWGRRALTSSTLCVAGVLTLITAFVPKGVSQVALASTVRFLLNISYNALIQWATELLPTTVRASGSALVHVSGYTAVTCSPFIVYFKQYWDPLPLVIFGIMALVSGCAGVLLPETRQRVLPQTLVDGEKLVREKSFFRKQKHYEDAE